MYDTVNTTFRHDKRKRNLDWSWYRAAVLLPAVGGDDETLSALNIARSAFPRGNAPEKTASSEDTDDNQKNAPGCEGVTPYLQLHSRGR